MCGIAGIYRFGDAEPEPGAARADRAGVEAMLERLTHRGPDDHGLESLGRVTLGARRLSILDVAAGHQPLCDAGGRVWAAQNGELYDYPKLRRDLEARHPLRTRNDTELLPYLWIERGPAAVEGLRGMFAAAIYDAPRRTLLLARDPMGIKPLYVAEYGGCLRFASELKALLADPGLPRELDPVALGSFLALGFVPGEATPFRSIRKVRPGCRVLVTPKGATTERYAPWPRFGVVREPVSFAESVREARRLLADAAESQLLSDVPVGLLLSGGLDSSVLAAVLPEARRRELHTFSIGFRDAGQHDERRYARQVAESLGTRHHEDEVPLDLAAELPGVVRALDEPCTDAAAIPALLIARAASSEVKVLLSGTGGDEVFGGYRRYELETLLARLTWLPRSVAGLGARLLADGRQHRSTASGERMIWLRKLLEARERPDPLSAYLSVFAPAAPDRLRAALNPGARVNGTDAEGRMPSLAEQLRRELGELPPPGAAMARSVDFLFYLPDDLLLKEDRCTMAVSVEGRVPYLDPALVSWSSGLPAAFRRGPEGSKRVLRAIGRELLPESIVRRPKHGFSVPIEAWLRGPLDALAADVLSAPASPLFDPAALRRWRDEHRRGRDRSGALWLALVFELWWREVATARAVPSGAPTGAAA